MINDSTPFLDKEKSSLNLEQFYNIIYTKTKKFTIFIPFLILLFAYSQSEDNNLKILQNITYKENFINKNRVKYKGRKYLDNCLKGNLINNKKFEFSYNPKITMIIPIYNTGELIKSVVRSIQNQNMLDIEIILVNDFSNDNGYTLNIIEKLKEEDPRIIIINNKKNMGILYSRCISVLQARGEYIMNLDHDDFLFDDDVFDTTYKSAKNSNVDIISFMYIESKEYNCKLNELSIADYLQIPHHHIILQPRLSIYPFFKDDNFFYGDYTIWAKLYKNKIYKKTVDFLTYERYSVFNIYNEDLVGLFAICNVAESYQRIRKIGVYHRVYSASTSHSLPANITIFCDIFFSEVILDLGKKQFKKYGAIFLVKRLELYNDKNNTYLIHVLNKMMNSEYIDEKYKEKLRKNFEKILQDNK